MELRDKSYLDLHINGEPAINQLNKLDASFKMLKQEQKELVEEMRRAGNSEEQIRASEAYRELSREIAANRKEREGLRKEMSLEELSVKELKGLVRDLTKEYEKATDPATRQALADRIGTVNGRLDELSLNVKKQEGLWGDFKGWILRAFTFGAILEAGRQLIGFFQDAYAESRKLDSALGEFAANTGQEYKTATGALSAEMEFFKKTAKEIGPVVGLTADDTVKAFQYIGSAKSDLIESKEGLAAVTEEAIALSQAAKIGLPEAASVLGGAMNQFEKEAEDASAMINTMAASAQVGAHEISDVAAALKVSGTVAHATNVSFEQTNAVMASLSKINLKGAEAGTQFRNVLLTLASGAKETNPQMVGLEKALENLGKKNLSTAELTKLFGKENLVAAQHLVTHAGEVRDYTKAVTGTDAAYKMQADNLNNQEAQMKIAQAQFKAQASELGDRFAPAVLKVIQGFNSLLDWTRQLTSGQSTLSPVLQGVGQIFEAVYEAVISLFKAGWELVVALFPGLAKETAGTTNAMRIFSTILYSIVAAVKLVVGIVQVMIDNFRSAIVVIDSAWKVLKGDMSIKEAMTNITASVDRMKSNATKNFSEIGEGFKKIWADGGKVAEAQAKATTKTTKEESDKQLQNHAEHLTEKEKREAAKREREKKREAEKEDKVRQQALKDHEETLAAKEKANLEAIADERQRKIALLMWEFEHDVDKINKQKISEQEKREAIEAGERALRQKITDFDKEYREKKKEEDEKLRKETQEKERKRLEEQQAAEFGASKATLERQLLDKTLSVKERARLELELLKLETDNKLANLKIRFDNAIATAQAEGRDTTALKAQYDAEKKLLEDQYQAHVREATAQTREQQKAKAREYFNALGDMMQGNFQSALDLMAKEFAGYKKHLGEKTQAFVDKSDQILEYGKMALNLLSQLNEMELKKQLARNEKEKKDTLAQWEAKYKKGLIDKATYEIGLDRINKDFDQKQKDLAFRAWRRQKNIDIALAVVNGAQAALKSLATFGWPIGAVMAALAVVQTGIQIAAIKRTEPPQFARGGWFRNAGVPRGPGHERGGVKLVDNVTGEVRGEMEGGEPIMILSRATYRNNKRVVDALLNSSLHRSGKPIFRDGGIFADSPSSRDYRLFPDGGLIDDGGRSRDDGRSDPGNREQEMETTTSGGDPGYWDTSAGETYMNEVGDYSGAYEANGKYDQNIQLSQQQMQKIVDNTAHLAEIRDLLRDGNSIQRDQSGKLDGINSNTQRAADKPSINPNEIADVLDRRTRVQEEATFK